MIKTISLDNGYEVKHNTACNSYATIYDPDSNHIATVFVGNIPDDLTDGRRIQWMDKASGLSLYQLIQMADEAYAQVSEDNNKDTISFDDVSKLNSNVDMEECYDDQDTEFFVKVEHGCDDIQYKDDTINIYSIGQDFESGYIVYVNSKPKHIITIYEPHGVSFIASLGAIIAYGHEQIIILNLNDGTFDEIYTR